MVKLEKLRQMVGGMKCKGCGSTDFVNIGMLPLKSAKGRIRPGHKGRWRFYDLHKCLHCGAVKRKRSKSILSEKWHKKSDRRHLRMKYKKLGVEI